MGKKEKKRSKNAKRLGRLLLLLLLGIALFFIPPLPQEYDDLRSDSSLILTDRHGQVLRSELSEREGMNEWLPLKDIPILFQDAILLAEDKRFSYHPGIDPLAIIRASVDNLDAGRVVSGASTITQQTLRTLRQDERTLGNKLKEMYWALRFECRYSKEEILEAYLNRVSFGPNIYGVSEASRYYFDKPVSALSTAEIVSLAVSVRSPTSLNPFAAEAQDRSRWTEHLLQKLLDNGHISLDAQKRASREELKLSPAPPPFLAPHFCELLLPRLQESHGEVQTTLDLSIQRTVEQLIRTHLALLSEHRVENAAVIVCEIESGEILAMVGSPDYHRSRDGQHNAAVSLRQPGSTIKPFTYALLMQKTGHAGSILPDLDLYPDAENESFVPQNYDNHFHGPVSIRTALACSYNVPAVRALEMVGTENLLQILRRSGMEDLNETPEHYGLGLTLGDGSTSLYQLIGAFRVLARVGQYSPLRLRPKESEASSVKTFLDARSCYLISEILSDNQARIPSFGTPNSLEFPFPVAVKTGTSKGYRDNWAIGFTGKHLVGVWVGNSDGSPMENVSGITGAGPLFRDIVLSLGDGGPFSRPEGLVDREICVWSGELATEKCAHSVTEACFEEIQLGRCQVCRRDEESGENYLAFPSLYQDWARERGLPIKRQSTSSSDDLRFVFPQSGDVFLTDPDLKRQFQRVKFKVAGGSPPYRWSVDGKSLTSESENSLWWPLSVGPHMVRVEDSEGVVKELPISVFESSK